MIVRIILLATIFIVILSLSAPVITAEDGSGVIEGQVINWTESGSSTAEQDITLTTYLNNAEVGSNTTKTDAEGTFNFEDLSTESGYDYQISLYYQEAEYSTSTWFEEDETTKFVEIAVYDSTASDEAISVAVAHTAIYVEEDGLRINEFVLFVNEGDRTYVGSEEVTADENKETLRFSLPEGATEIQPLDGLMECCVFLSEEGFIDTMPVTPGSQQAVFSYRIEPGSGTFNFSKVVDYPTTTYNLFVQDAGIGVVSDQLTMEEPFDIEGTQFVYLSGSDFAPGSTIVARISGLPEGSNRGILIWTVAGFIVLACGAGFGYLLIRKRSRPISPEVITVQSDLEQRNQKLLLEIAQLDDDFEGGKISPEMYQSMRSEKKTQLLELMRQLRGEGNGEQGRQSPEL
jgi:hypothetical protein